MRPTELPVACELSLIRSANMHAIARRTPCVEWRCPSLILIAKRNTNCANYYHNAASLGWGTAKRMRQPRAKHAYAAVIWVNRAGTVFAQRFTTNQPIMHMCNLRLRLLLSSLQRRQACSLCLILPFISFLHHPTPQHVLQCKPPARRTDEGAASGDDRSVTAGHTGLVPEQALQG